METTTYNNERINVNLLPELQSELCVYTAQLLANQIREVKLFECFLHVATFFTLLWYTAALT